MTIPFLLALAITLVPLAAGLGAGRLLAGRTGRRGTVAGLLVAMAAPVAGWALPPGAVAGIGSWDLAWMGGWLGAGLASGVLQGRRRPGWSEGLRAIAGVLLMAAVLEAGSRGLPMPPAFPPADQARFLDATVVGDAVGGPEVDAGLFPDDFPSWLAGHRRQAEGAARRILHVGDSMVAGVGVAADDAFPAVLGRLEPGTAHLNAGVPGTSADFQWRLVRNWIRRLPIDRVVLYLCENDVREIGQRYAPCGDSPLYDWTPDGPVDRCPSRVADTVPARPRRLSSPPPYALRVMTGVSRFARHACAALDRLAEGPGADWAVRRQRFEAAVRALRDTLAGAGIPLTLVAVPSRGWIESDLREGRGAPADDATRGFAGLARRLDLPLLDPGPTFAQGVARDGVTSLFLAAPEGNPHLSVEGHRRMAEWLQRALATPPAPPSPTK